MPIDLTDDKSTLVQVMAWCLRQQAITWATIDPDLFRQMVSLGNNVLTGTDKLLPRCQQPWQNGTIYHVSISPLLEVQTIKNPINSPWKSH